MGKGTLTGCRVPLLGICWRFGLAAVALGDGLECFWKLCWR